MRPIKNDSVRAFLIFSVLIIAISMLLPRHSSATEKAGNNEETPIVFRIYAFMPQHIVMQKYSDLTEYIGTLLNKEVKISISSDTDEFLNQIGTGKFDLAFIDSVNYTKLINTSGRKKIIAILSFNSQPYYFENIVVANNTSYQKINDLNQNNIKFAFSIDQSKSIIQEAMLTEGGIEKKYLKHRKYYIPKFAYKEMVSALKKGKCSAGCMDDVLLNKYKESLRSIAKSGPIPAPMILANESLSVETIEKIKNALFNLHNEEDGKSIISKINDAYNQFSPPEKINFDYLKKILNKNPGKHETVKMGQGINPWEKSNGCPPFYLRTDAGEIINPITGQNSDKPYSTKKTCGFCHDYNKISQGYHFQMGMNEREDFNNKKSPWKVTPGMTGGW